MSAGNSVIGQMNLPRASSRFFQGEFPDLKTNVPLSHLNFAMRSCSRNGGGMAYTVRSTLACLCDPPAESPTMSEQRFSNKSY
jgi:hypothetical protein